MSSKNAKVHHSEEERIERTNFLEKRARLLSKVHDLEDTSASSSDVHDQILRLKEENNHIMEELMAKMSRIRHGPPVDPYSRLPIEAFTAIIAWIKGPFDRYGWYIDVILSLTLVSTSWRNAILSTPSLWDEIKLDGKINGLQMKLFIALHLSKQIPIKLQIQCLPSLWKEVEPLLLPHRDRITSLMLNIDLTATRSMESIPTILQRLGHLPYLDSFRCDLYHSKEAIISSINTFLKENQHIRYVSGILLTKDIDSSICKKLKSCRTMLDPQVILADLEAAPYLEEVHFMDNFLRTINADPYHGVPEVMYLPEAPLKWKNHSQNGKISLRILDSIAATVTTLRLHICACDLWSLFSILCNFATLDYLDLSLVVGGNHPLTPPPASPPLPCRTLRELALRFDRGYSFQAAASQYTQDWRFPFFEAVHQTCGSIESLVLLWGFELPVQWHLIEGFTKLEKLSVSTSRHGLNSPPPSLVFPSSLKRIYLYGDVIDFLTLHSDTVESLNIFVVEPFKIIQKSRITLSNWPDLTSLFIPAYTLAMDWSGGQMRNLGSISLDNNLNVAWDHFTHFCCNLALHPEAIPQLTTLNLEQSPEWDILFILLERYNFRTTADSERIRWLTVGDTPFNLLKPLRMLCGGKFTERPPNVELCWIGNVDIIFDESLYQFNSELYNADVVVNILLKALTATPSPDFNLCLALLSERIPNVNAGEDADVENDPATLIPILSSLSKLLHECRFPAFWLLYRDDSLAYLRDNFTVEIVGFEDAIRDVVVKAVKSTFTKIGVARLGSYLDLSGDSLETYIAKVGWTLDENTGTVAIPANPDNTIQATVVRESLNLQRTSPG
ncbi:hypothetical protein FRC17_005415 [Serendipita sp. 399]|nr:hypothetical protein FRC17_005415 [Serendipita sp. 399]